MSGVQGGRKFYELPPAGEAGSLSGRAQGPQEAAEDPEKLAHFIKEQVVFQTLDGEAPDTNSVFCVRIYRLFYSKPVWSG